MNLRSLSSLVALIAFTVSCGGPIVEGPAGNASTESNGEASTESTGAPTSTPQSDSRDFAINGFEVTTEVDYSTVSCADRLTVSGAMNIVGEPGPQLQFNREPVTELKTAFIRATFSDTPEAARAEFPSVADLEALFLDPESRIQKYLDHVSYGQFMLSGEFVADIVLDAPAERDGVQTENADLGLFDISIPDFRETDYDQIVLVMISDFNRGRSESGQLYLPDSWQFTVNGSQLTQLCGVIGQFAHVGHSYRDTSFPFANDFTELTQYVLNPESETEELGLTVPLTPLERTFIHELIHALGIQTHAYSSTNGDQLHNQPEVENNQDFLWRDYGNLYDIMGNNEYSYGLNAGYRELLGWIGDDRTVRIDEIAEPVQVVLQPLDSMNGHVLAEVRRPGQYFMDDPVLAAVERYENQGYLFEVWPTADPYYWMSEVGLTGGSGGLVIYRTDGASTAVLDASPSPNIVYSWGTLHDLSDIALVPGEVFDDGIVRVENVELLADGSVSFEVSLVEGG